jgi:CheY-like chemotaxis protein
MTISPPAIPLDAMHVLVLDDSYTNGLTWALQLSGYGVTVESVPDTEEAARRLSLMKFDAVLSNVPACDGARSARLQALRQFYPDTAFYTSETIDDLLRRIRRIR